MTTTMRRLKLLAVPAATLLLAFCGSDLRAQTVVNGDFETGIDAFVTWPGYVANGDNPAEILGWTGGGGHGINPVVPAGEGDAPFRDNGGNTTAVAFLQGSSFIQQAVSGFTPGLEYELSLDFNARNCCGDFPIGEIYLNDILAGSSVDEFPDPGAIIPVGDTNPWYNTTIQFEAPTDTITVRLQAAPAAGGDATMLVDNVRFSLVPEPASGVLGLLGLLGLLAVRRR